MTAPDQELRHIINRAAKYIEHITAVEATVDTSPEVIDEMRKLVEVIKLADQGLDDPSSVESVSAQIDEILSTFAAGVSPEFKAAMKAEGVTMPSAGILPFTRKPR